jgi:hypothetical protein
MGFLAFTQGTFYMAIRYRPMRPNDVRECVEVVAAHPTIGPRYGNAIADLAPAWLRLLYNDGFGAAVVFEEANGAGVKKLGVSVSVFVHDEFMNELKVPPHFWIGPELTRRVLRGNSPLLSPAQVREANRCGGLNLLVWQATVRPEARQRADVFTSLPQAFMECHRGFLLKEVAAHPDSLERLQTMRNCGGLLWDGAKAGYYKFPEDGWERIVKEPHISGITRTLALSERGSWLASLFIFYEPPKIGFSRSEQRLLLSAMHGSTDQELCEELAVSLDAVKKAWRSIYDRVAVCLPDLFASDNGADNGTNRRGKGKKQHVVAYLREHPEELRPVSRKALQNGRAPSRPSPQARAASRREGLEGHLLSVGRFGCSDPATARSGYNPK